VIAPGRIATALMYQRHGRKPPRAGKVRARPPTARNFEREYQARLLAILRAWSDHVETIARAELRADALEVRTDAKGWIVIGRTPRQVKDGGSFSRFSEHATRELAEKRASQARFHGGEARVVPREAWESGVLSGEIAATEKTIAEVKLARGAPKVAPTVSAEAGAMGADMRSAWRALLNASGLQQWLRRNARSVAGVQAKFVERVANLPVANAIPQDAIEDFLQDNLSLVTKMADKQVQQIADIVRPAQAGGQRWEEVAEQIQERLGVTQSRAKLFARDQANKFNAAVAETTQTAAGVEEYEWVTANDFAVRGRPGGEYEDSEDNHWKLHGKIFRWDAPPIVNPKTGERAHPGNAIHCRCTARPVIDLFAQRAAPARPADIVAQERAFGFPRR